MSDATPLSVHLLGFDNGVGLSRDLRLLARTLEACGFRVDFTNTCRRGGIPGLAQKILGKRHAAQQARHRRLGQPPPYDFVLMEEHVAPAYLDDARHRVLLPHPEWCLPRDVAALDRIDLVLTKTREAERIFAVRGCPATCIGFTSDDRQDRSVPRERAFFHLAGSSRTKATEPLLALWRRHPEWPKLTVVQHPGEARPATPVANIDHRIGYLDEAGLKRLQNAHRFHLCPSETEGFGHYIVEAMSVGAVVITLDAPPMNEMITPERGILLPTSRTGTQHLATTYHFDATAMEAAIARAIAMPDAECERLGLAARAWYEAERTAFPGRLDDALRGMLPAGDSA
ncbi:MAG: glycosyltransferase family 4 protein [Proteobacteria bacterium]|nr:glycosyltransferase family 4 protein [Pseudomonadota bacterium]